jgi:hypothetical protein
MSVYCWVPNHDSSEQPLQAPPVLSSANTHPAAADGSAAAAAAAVRVAPATSSNAGGVESGSCGAGASAVKVIVGVSTHTDSGDAATEPRNRHALVCADGSVYASRTVGWDIDRWGPLVEVAGIAEQGGATQFTFFALPEVMLCVTREGRLITRGEFQGPCKYLGRVAPARSSGWQEALSDVRAISTGSTHAAAIRRDGSLYTWGGNLMGQLGHGAVVDGRHVGRRGPRNSWFRSERDVCVPRPVAGLGPAYGLRVAAVAAGSYFTLALLANGQVFSWGDNTKGCLGIGMTSKECPSIATPQPISALATTTVVGISAGVNYVLACDDKGYAYTWGDARSCGALLGLRCQCIVIQDETAVVSRPSRIIGELGRERVVQVCCGWGSSAALTASDKIYCWGGLPADIGLLEISATDDEEILTPTLSKIMSGRRLSLVSEICGRESAIIAGVAIPRKLDVFAGLEAAQRRLAWCRVFHTRNPNTAVQISGAFSGAIHAVHELSPDLVEAVARLVISDSVHPYGVAGMREADQASTIIARQSQDAATELTKTAAIAASSKLAAGEDLQKAKEALLKAKEALLAAQSTLDANVAKAKEADATSRQAQLLLADAQVEASTWSRLCESISQASSSPCDRGENCSDAGCGSRKRSRAQMN